MCAQLLVHTIKQRLRLLIDEGLTGYLLPVLRVLLAAHIRRHAFELRLHRLYFLFRSYYRIWVTIASDDP
jgi:hypothetical protein